MHVTRRSWTVVALAVVLAGYAIVVANPLALAGSVLLGAWFLGRQAAFAATLERTVDALSIEQIPERSVVRTVDAVSVTLAAILDEPSPLALEVRSGLPTAARAESRLTISLAPGASTSASADGPDETAEDGSEPEGGSVAEATTTAVTWPVTGRHRFETPTVTATDGWFRETLPTGSAPTVTVEPPEPRTVHVGEGGDRVLAAYGEHQSNSRGSGLEPAEIREYMPGDTADHIDWKATARFATPHVREYEAETNRRTTLVVDHRGALATGRTRETKLDYLREAALAMAARARRLGDPIGLVTVGDEGITTRLDPVATPGNYQTIRRRLLEIEPTAPVERDTERRPERGQEREREHEQPTAATIRRTLESIEGDESAFSARLQPFYADRRTYRERLESDPLYGSVRSALARAHGAVLTVLFTDDSSPGELRETVKLARESGNEVVVLLAPTVLYEPGGLTDLERAYDRYLEFENLRRELARMDRVTALEVGPADRLATVLETGRSEKRTRVRNRAHRRERARGRGGVRS